MFMDTGKPGPPPIAEGVYWLLAPVAVVTATLTFVGWFGHIADQKLVQGFAAALDLCRAPVVAAAGAVREGLLRVAHLLPNGWSERLTFCLTRRAMCCSSRLQAPRMSRHCLVRGFSGRGDPSPEGLPHWR